MTKERQDPFAPGPDDVDASAFTTRPIQRPDAAAVKQAAVAAGFTSREPTLRPGDTQRRHRTGRTAQLNLKVTPELKAHFGQLADQEGVSQNELFERTVTAFEAAKEAGEGRD